MSETEQPRKGIATDGGAVPTDPVADAVGGAVGGAPPAPVVKPRDPRGRHRKNCDCPLCAARRKVDVGENAAADASLVDPALVRRCTTAVLRAADNWTRRQVTLRATRLAGPETAEELAQAVALSDEEIELTAEIAGELANKYATAGRYAPEIALAVLLAGHGARIQAALARLSELERQDDRPQAD